MTGTPPRLEVRNLVRRFDGRTVVDDVSLTIEAGQVTCLLGPSGCGKSTTLRMIAGVDMQDQGTIHVDGKLICDTVFRIPPERRSIGLMFQDFALFPHLSVAENIAFGLKGAATPRVDALLERVSLSGFGPKYPHELSGGEQQRVAILRAILHNPTLLLADEPTGNLDWEMSLRLLTLLSELNRMGKTIVIATHDLNLIRAAKPMVSARVLRIKDRQIIHAGAEL